MSDRPRLIPDAGHPITIEANPHRVIVRTGERVIADTGGALTLREASYPPVHYIPRTDTDMALLRRSDRSTYCPYKGDAAYFDVVPLGANGAGAVWTYEEPYEAVAEIAGYLAFYPDRVSISEQPR